MQISSSTGSSLPVGSDSPVSASDYLSGAGGGFSGNKTMKIILAIDKISVTRSSRLAPRWSRRIPKDED